MATENIQSEKSETNETVICELCGKPAIPYTECINESTLHDIDD